MIARLKLIASSIGLTIGWLIGENNALLYTLLAFICLDYISGVILAIHEKKLKSAVGFKGISKKVAILIIVSVGHILDTYIFYDGSALKTTILLFYITNEVISILENCGKLGLPLPKKLLDVLERIGDDKPRK